MALITGHPVQLITAAAGSAVGLLSKPSACEAAEATQVPLSSTAGLLAAVAFYYASPLHWTASKTGAVVNSIYEAS